VSAEDLRSALQETAAATDLPHVERLTFAAAIIATALERAGMTAMLVGGGAIEFYAPGAYTTADIDLVVQGANRDRLAPVFESLGLTSKDRHWFIGDLWVEVPGTTLDDPYEPFDLGPYRLRVVRKEIVLGQRVIGFRYWKYWGYGLQAIAMIRAFGQDLDDAVLRTFLRRDQAEAAYELLKELATSGEQYTERDLDQVWHSRYR
jgi:hypothetical protein